MSKTLCASKGKERVRGEVKGLGERADTQKKNTKLTHNTHTHTKKCAKKTLVYKKRRKKKATWIEQRAAK